MADLTIPRDAFGDWDGRCTREENGKFLLTHWAMDHWLVFDSDEMRKAVEVAFEQVIGGYA